MFWKNKTQTSLNFLGEKRRTGGALSLLMRVSDVIWTFVFFCFFPFFLDRSIDRERERDLSRAKRTEAIDGWTLSKP